MKRIILNYVIWVFIMLVLGCGNNVSQPIQKDPSDLVKMEVEIALSEVEQPTIPFLTQLAFTKSVEFLSSIKSETEVDEILNRTKSINGMKLSDGWRENLKSKLNFKDSIEAQEKGLHRQLSFASINFEELNSTFEEIKTLLNDKNFSFSKVFYESNLYEGMLEKLSKLATHPLYFGFATRQLLEFSAAEGKLGIYKGNYKAFPVLEEQFYNTSTETKVCLKTKRAYLEKFLKEATIKYNYYLLYNLLRLLGSGADVFNNGEYEYVEDPYYEKYIDFCIKELMKFAGIEDENGLSLTAEDELHSILKYTIDEPEILGAHIAPFRILKMYLETEPERQWNISPLYAIYKFYESLKEYKESQELDKDYTQKLEFRLEQLGSLLDKGKFIAKDFTLYLGSNNPEKYCEISVGKDILTNLELHERQSLAERLIFTGQDNLHDIARGYPKTTYLIANFGLVFTDRPHRKGEIHKRIFKTIPIEFTDNVIVGRENASHGHAEDAFYELLLREKNILNFLSNFRRKFGLKTPGHKIYGIVFDLHGTYDMCLECSNKAENFQNEFRDKFLSMLSKQDIKVTNLTPKQLPIIIRYSSDLKYHYEKNSELKKNGLLTLLKKEGTKHYLPSTSLKDSLAYTPQCDIRCYGANLLIHGDDGWHELWNLSKIQKCTSTVLPLEDWSAFTTDYSYGQLNQEQRKKKYTKDGLVITKKK